MLYQSYYILYLTCIIMLLDVCNFLFPKGTPRPRPASYTAFAQIIRFEVQSFVQTFFAKTCHSTSCEFYYRLYRLFSLLCNGIVLRSIIMGIKKCSSNRFYVTIALSNFNMFSLFLYQLEFVGISDCSRYRINR